MIGQSLQLQPEGAQPLAAQRRLRAGEGFAEQAMGGGVRQRGVAGNRFHLRQRGAVRTAEQGAFNAAMLVSERNFQMQHFLAVALEPKVSWLDHAGVHRTNRHLVHLASVDPEELTLRGKRPGGGTHGLEPRVPGRVQAVLFPEFAFEEVGLRAQQGERRIRAGARRAPGDAEDVVGVEGNHGHDGHATRLRLSKPGAEAPSFAELPCRGFDQGVGRPGGHFRPRQGRAIGEQGKGRGGGAHGVEVSWVTAADQICSSSGGGESPSQAENPSRTRGGRITPAVSTNRGPAGGGRRRGGP